jgi:hypothetical protein
MVGIADSNMSAFSVVMGPMKLEMLSFFGTIVGDLFTRYFPILILIIAFGTALDIIARVLTCCDIPRFVFDVNKLDQTIEEGRDILKKHRREREKVIRQTQGRKKKDFTRKNYSRVMRYLAQKRAEKGKSTFGIELQEAYEPMPEEDEL